MSLLKLKLVDKDIKITGEALPKPIVASPEDFAELFPLIDRADTGDDELINLVSSRGDKYGKYHFLAVGLSFNKLAYKLSDHILINTLTLSYPHKVITKGTSEAFRDAVLDKTARTPGHKTKYGFTSQALIHPSAVSKITDHGTYRAIELKKEYGAHTSYYTLTNKARLEYVFELLPEQNNNSRPAP